MKIITTVLVLTFIFLSCEEKKKTIELTNGLYIANVTIISNKDDSYQPFEGHIIIEGDDIIYVDEAAPNISGNYKKIDGNGKYLIPGLIDSHVHIMQINGMTYEHIQKHSELVKQYKEQVPRSYLYFGFTSLINLGGITPEYLEWLESQPMHPELYHTGRSGAAVANGYPMNNTPEEFRFDYFPNFIYLESEVERIPKKFKPEDHTPKTVVNRIKESGAIAVKSYYETGWDASLPKLPVPTRSLMEKLQTQAHENGLPLTVHGNSYEAHSFLTEVEVDIIAHGLWNWGEYSDAPADSLPAEIKQVLDSHIEKQIGYTPTLAVIDGLGVLADPQFLQDTLLPKVVPEKMIDWYKTDEGQWFAKEIVGEGAPKEIRSQFAGIQSRGQLALKYLSDNGGKILFGTDTPSAPTYGNQPGFTGYSELKQMHDSGLSLEDILKSATLSNAKAFHLDSLIGSIAVGKRANLLLLDKNPLEEIEAYNSISEIILRGKAIERKDLSVKQY